MIKFSKFLLITILILSTECKNLRFLQMKEKRRRSGILMHITSLPSKYGIGTLGDEAYNFVKFLVKAKQKEWQVLPLGPTSYGDSPYQVFSSFAGNHYLIDLDYLIKEKLLTQEEVDSVNWGNDSRYVDFGNLFIERNKILRKAFERFKPNDDYLQFVKTQNYWLEDYSLFMALKSHFDYKSWIDWPKDIKLRKESEMTKYKKELGKEMKFHMFLQYKFNEQWVKLRTFCHENGIKIIGDVPIYVALDSSDTWSSPENFQLDKDGFPKAVAGVPPDAFTADGQLWGNPLYDWDKMKKDNFKWWIMRLKATSEKFDTIRIDHFRGLEAYWSVPYGDKTARNGKWIKGPDKDFIKALHDNLPKVNFIAEDLGYLTQEVLDLRNYSKYPGMKLLQFAFDSREASDYLPYGYEKNTVCYLGTHDNDTVEGWQKALNPNDRNLAERFLGLKPGDNLRWPLIRVGFATVSDLFVGTLQDYIGIGSEGRMNTPGVMNGKNWIWRALPGEYNEQLADKIAELTVLYGRY